MERSAQSEVLGLAKSSTQPTRSLVNRSYATYASHYQIMPIGVVAPGTIKQARIALAIGREGASSSRRAAAAAFVLTCPSRSGQESNFGLRFLPIRQP
jgi:hypothetical protein